MMLKAFILAAVVAVSSATTDADKPKATASNVPTASLQPPPKADASGQRKVLTQRSRRGNTLKAFVTDVALTQSTTCPSGFIREGLNLNKGAGGKDIFLCYSTQSTTGSDMNSNVVLDLKLERYWKTNHDGWIVVTGPGLNGDLNQDAEGYDIYLFKKRGVPSQNTNAVLKVQSVYFCPVNNIKIGGGTGLNGNLNQGAGGSELFFCVTYGNYDTCELGEYLNGATCTDCQPGEYQAQYLRRTVCSAQPTCDQGQLISSDSSTTIQTCSGCPDNTFQSKNDHREEQCTPQSTCGQGQSISGDSKTEARTCSVGYDCRRMGGSICNNVPMTVSCMAGPRVCGELSEYDCFYDACFPPVTDIADLIGPVSSTEMNFNVSALSDLSAEGLAAMVELAVAGMKEKVPDAMWSILEGPLNKLKTDKELYGKFMTMMMNDPCNGVSQSCTNGVCTCTGDADCCIDREIMMERSMCEAKCGLNGEASCLDACNNDTEFDLSDPMTVKMFDLLGVDMNEAKAVMELETQKSLVTAAKEALKAAGCSSFGPATVTTITTATTVTTGTTAADTTTSTTTTTSVALSDDDDVWRTNNVYCRNESLGLASIASLSSATCEHVLKDLQATSGGALLTYCGQTCGYPCYYSFRIKSPPQTETINFLGVRIPAGSLQRDKYGAANVPMEACIAMLDTATNSSGSRGRRDAVQCGLDCATKYAPPTWCNCPADATFQKSIDECVAGCTPELAAVDCAALEKAVATAESALADHIAAASSAFATTASLAVAAVAAAAMVL